MKDNRKYEHTSEGKDKKYINRFDSLSDSEDLDNDSNKISSNEALSRKENIKKSYKKEKIEIS